MAPETLSGEDKRKELQSIEKFELEPGGGLGGLGSQAGWGRWVVNSDIQ
jgi:hypothetical protein